MMSVISLLYSRSLITLIYMRTFIWLSLRLSLCSSALLCTIVIIRNNKNNNNNKRGNAFCVTGTFRRSDSAVTEMDNWTRPITFISCLLFCYFVFWNNNNNNNNRFSYSSTARKGFGLYNYKNCTAPINKMNVILNECNISRFLKYDVESLHYMKTQ